MQINGPHRADMSILVALNECEKIEEQIEQIEQEEKRLKAAYRIFQFDLINSKELQSIKKVCLDRVFWKSSHLCLKDVEILKSIWLLAKEYEDILAQWKTTEFRQLQIDPLHDFAQNLYRKIFRMSREFKVNGGGMDCARIEIFVGEKLGDS